MDPTSFVPTGILPVVAGLFGLLAVVAYARSIVAWRKRSKNLPLPPGPKPLPFIGNLLDMPQLRPWIKFREHSLQYGGIVSYQALGQPIIVLNTTQATSDLLDKRSANYSDRPPTPITDLIGWKWNLAMQRYGPEWRWHRRLFWQHFHPGVLFTYDDAQNRESVQFLQRILDNPSHLEQHAHHTFAGVILRAVYGIDISDADTNKATEEVVDIVGTVMDAFRTTSVPGAFLVEFVPVLRYVPAWFPGAGFQTRLVNWRAASARMVTLPYEKAKAAAAMNTGGISSTLVGAALLGEGGVDGIPAEEREFVIKNVACTSYAGGVDTSLATLLSFFLAMSLYPEAQKKAQAELDAVIGPNRLPSPADRAELPYINALMKESHRWQNAVPMGLPHAAVKDDEYNGYFIPAGATILPNVWGMLHDPDEYPNPDAFLPERFLNPDRSTNEKVRDPVTVVFGFGRRLCPGRYFAEQALFLNMSRVLYAFDITPPLDELGRRIVIEPQMKNGALSGPVDCRCTIKPRSARSAALIREATAELFAARRQ
ncbi:CyP450 monooxygenase [Ganoderma leucocontextum]|nr:CyP450 monooxygenase [Ganoderma leucocontextum]